jgi:thiamine biosynthesis protein ThiS
VQIKLNGASHEIPGPMSVAALLARLGIDARRVAVERNLVVLKRANFETTIVGEGDELEIVNFVGGGQAPAPSASGPERDHRRLPGTLGEGEPWKTH